MEYLKEFKTENDYLAYRDGGGYVKPNVSLCDDNGNVYYNLNNNGHDYVDLGLSSGTLWATMNVGASKPSDSGLYFQWGDITGYTAEQVGKGEGKKAFIWADYKWSIDGSSSNFSKYNTAGATLELADDAANANMGGSWHMPSPTQLKELTANTTNTWTSQNGVNGRLFKSKKDASKSIFIPVAGYAWDGSVHDSRIYGYVWSSMLREYDVSLGQYLYSVYLHDGGRYNGLSVRGVLG